jgi:hypothetical protein
MPMRRARIAEWILRLVTTQGRAAATVGDLLEICPNALWFWVTVARTGAAAIVSDFRAEPARMIWIGLSGWLLQAGGFTLLGLSFNAVSLNVPLRWMQLSINLYTVLLCTMVGARAAKRGPGVELAACCSIAITDVAINAAILAIASAIHSPFVHFAPAGLFIVIVPTLLAGVWARHRRTAIL